MTTYVETRTMRPGFAHGATYEDPTFMLTADNMEELKLMGIALEAEETWRTEPVTGYLLSVEQRDKAVGLGAIRMSGERFYRMAQSCKRGLAA